MASEEADGIIIHAGVLTKQLAFVLGRKAEKWQDRTPTIEMVVKRNTL